MHLLFSTYNSNFQIYMCKFRFLISDMEKHLLLKFTGCMETHYVLNIFMLNIIQIEIFWKEMNTPN